MATHSPSSCYRSSTDILDWLWEEPWIRHGRTELLCLSSCWAQSSGVTLRQDTNKKWTKSRKLIWKQQLQSPAEFLPARFPFIRGRKKKK